MKDVDRSESHYRAALAVKCEGRYGDAERQLRLAIESNECHALAYEESGFILLRLDSESPMHEAKGLLERAISLDSSLPDAELYLGVVLHHLRSLQVAEAHFQRAVVLSGRSALYLAEYGDSVAVQGRFVEAESLFSGSPREGAKLPSGVKGSCSLDGRHSEG